MQILNISVMNRPYKTLTSLMYTIYMPDSISIGVEVLDANVRDVVNRYDTPIDIVPKIQVQDATLREGVIKYRDKEQHCVYNEILIQNAVLADTLTRYNSGYSSVKHSITVSDATRKDVLLRYNVENQFFTNSIKVCDAILEG